MRDAYATVWTISFFSQCIVVTWYSIEPLMTLFLSTSSFWLKDFNKCIVNVFSSVQQSPFCTGRTNRLSYVQHKPLFGTLKQSHDYHYSLTGAVNLSYVFMLTHILCSQPQLCVYGSTTHILCLHIWRIYEILFLF